MFGGPTVRHIGSDGNIDSSSSQDEEQPKPCSLDAECDPSDGKEAFLEAETDNFREIETSETHEEEPQPQPEDEREKTKQQKRNKIESKYRVNQFTMLPHLKHLHLGGCTKLSERCIISMVKRSPKLITLSIPAIFELTDLSLVYIASLNRLQHINLSLCATITDVGIRSLIRNCSNIKFMDLSGLPKISDNTLQEISNHCSHLKTLDIARSGPFSEEGLMEMVQGCINLNMLRLGVSGNQPRLPFLFFEKLKEMRQNLTVLKNYTPDPQ